MDGQDDSKYPPIWQPGNVKSVGKWSVLNSMGLFFFLTMPVIAKCHKLTIYVFPQKRRISFDFSETKCYSKNYIQSINENNINMYVIKAGL